MPYRESIRAIQGIGDRDKVFRIRNSRHHSHHFWHISGVNKDHLGGQDKVFEIRDRNHRIRRQILRQNEGLIIVLVKVENFHLRALEAI